MEAATSVVIFRLGSLGDSVVALPCFHKLAQYFPQGRRIVLTNAPVSSAAAPLDAILYASGLIHGTIAYPVQTRSPSVLWNLRRKLLALNCSTLVYLPPIRSLPAVLRDVLYFKACGFRRIIGMPLSADLRRNRVDPKTGLVEPECERLARTLSALGKIDLHDPAFWDLRLTDEERHQGLIVLQQFSGRPYIAINMGGKTIHQDWGKANWHALLSQIAPLLRGVGLLVIGAATDTQRAALVESLWLGPVINACGGLSPRESAAALEAAQLFIGHDSGPLHLATAMGVPCVGLFGSNPASPPNKWHPYLGKNRVIHRPEGISAITVAEVVDAVRSHLDIQQKRHELNFHEEKLNNEKDQTLI